MLTLRPVSRRQRAIRRRNALRRLLSLLTAPADALARALASL